MCVFWLFIFVVEVFLLVCFLLLAFFVWGCVCFLLCCCLRMMFSPARSPLVPRLVADGHHAIAFP